MRACSWAVRGADGPFEGRRHAPAARSSRWVTYTTRGSRLPSRRSSDSTCEGTGGASVNTQTGGSRRLLRCTSTPFGSALGASAAIGHGARLADAARCTTVCRVGQLGKSRVLKTKAGEMRALTVGLEHKQSAESAHPTPPSPRVRQFHLPRVVLCVFSEHGHHGHHGHP